MDAKGLSSLDLRFLARELQQLVGGRVQKIVQDGDSFLVELHLSGAGAALLRFDRSSLYLASERPPAPPEPPAFCMVLRKHLMGKPLRGISQYQFDRIMELKFPEAVLILELVPPGNIILCDSSCTIIMPLELQKWKDRLVRPRVPYQHPPLQQDPFSLTPDSLRGLLQEGGKSIVSALATAGGLGGLYAREACARAQVPEYLPAKELDREAAGRLQRALQEMDRSGGPARYGDAVTPFTLVSRPAGESCSSFSAGVEAFLRQQAEAGRQEAEKKQSQRAERIAAARQEAGRELGQAREESRSAGDLVYSHYSLVKAVLEGIRKALDSGLSWEDIREKARSEETGEARSIREFREKEGIVVVELDGRLVQLDIRLSPEQNAAVFFEKGKKAQRKLERLARLREKLPKKKAEPPPARLGKWYEAFWWFLTSDSFLVVGGKSAGQNEAVFRQHARAGDVVLHADIPGASLVVIQSSGRAVTPEARQEAAAFAAAHSRAWGRGLGTVDVYAVAPEQVSKTPPSGLSLGKGSFMITGRREWFRATPVRLAIGIRGGELVAGPPSSLQSADCVALIGPGTVPAAGLARKIKEALLGKAGAGKEQLERMPVERIRELIPYGTGEIAEATPSQSGSPRR